MTPTEARTTFARLMAEARHRSLTTAERVRLSKARQLLRRAARPAMNAAKKERFSVYVTDLNGGSSYRGDAYTLPKAIKIANSFARSPSFKGAFIVGKGGAVVWDSRHPRKAQRNPNGRCPTCGGAEGSPFRSYDERGRVVQGCVDEFHTGHLVTPSESARWHGRPEARKIRARLKKGRAGKGYGSNPSRDMQRLGRAVEVRYQRTIGRSPGYYKHEIRSRSAGVYTIPPGWVYVGTKSILITEREPRV